MTEPKGNRDEEMHVPKDLLVLRASVSRTFEAIAESVSEDDFLEAYTLLKSKRGAARRLYKALIGTLQKDMMTDFETMVEDVELEKKLNIIRKLSAEAQLPVGENAWRPPGDVNEHQRSWDAEKILQHTRELEKYVNAMEAENQILMRKVSEGRGRARVTDEKMKCMVKQDAHTCADFDKTIKQLKNNISKLDY